MQIFSNRIPISRRRVLAVWIAAAALAAFWLVGCVGPPALHDSVIGYDEVTNQLEREIMLLNIARAHDMSSLHFTVAGSIAATFDFTTTVGFSRRWVLNNGDSDEYNLNLGGSASENPTFTIVPISGKEFTQRLVNPMPEGAYATLVFQGRKIPIVTRLMSSGLNIQNRSGQFLRFIANSPRRPEQYQEFRRFTLHLAGLWYNQNLFVRNLLFDEVVIDGLKVQPKAEDLWKGEGLYWRLKADGTWRVTRRKKGRTLVSNYDPRSLTDEEQYALNEIARKNAGNYVMVDIRQGHPGGDMPYFGALKLRSFLDIITFVGRGIDRVPEFDVPPDPRTPEPVGDNPRQTLVVNVSGRTPPGGQSKARYRGQYYTLADSAWDREAFNVLLILFQVTVSDVSQVGIPITIAK